MSRRLRRTPGTDVYEPGFVRNLFQDMAATYGLVNVVSSLGFCQRWRARCVGQAPIRPGMAVYDLMCGMGECWPLIDNRLRGRGRLVGLDFSPAMCREARQTGRHLCTLSPALLEEDVLANSIPDASADCVISSFGLKTFSDEQKARLAREIARILRPGGSFSFLGISVPPAPLLRTPYMFYLKHVIPRIGQLFLGDPECYRLLGIYTEAFGDCRLMGRLMQRAGLLVEYRRFFFGCATSLVGRKPA